MFTITDTIDIDGFIRQSDDRIRILVDAKVKYYTQIPATEYTFGSAAEMLGHLNTYEVTLGLPISLAISRSGWINVDRDEAEERVGLKTWFDFTSQE
jgi:hypothetical protein